MGRSIPASIVLTPLHPTLSSMARNTQYRDALRRVSATPRSHISAAGHQNTRGLAALKDLVGVWVDVPWIMELGIIDVLLCHVRVEFAPSSTREWRDDAQFACLSLKALGEMADFFDKPKYDTQARALLAAWPRIVECSRYIYDFRRANSSTAEQVAYIAPIAGLFFGFSRFPWFQPSMVDTPGSVELVTNLWLWGFEGVENLENASISTVIPLLECLRYCSDKGRMDAHDKVLNAVDGAVGFLAQLLLRRMRKLCKRLDDPDTVSTHNAVSLHIELLVRLCQPDTHPFRDTFFDAGAITSVTRAFVALCRIISPNPSAHQNLLLLSCVSFLSMYLEADGYHGVVRAMKMGFLQAFLDCSPAFPQLPKDTVDIALTIVRDVLPPYAVYPSFVDAVTPFLTDREQENLSALPSIDTASTPFWSVLAERVHALGRIDNRVATRCDNTECQRVDTEDIFKICGGCQVAYYCSPECQKADWKAGHRSVCELVERGDRIGRRARRDLANIRTLVQNIVHLNSATFHEIAAREFPDTPRHELVPCIDLSPVPEVFGVRTFDDAIPERSRPIAEWYRSQGITHMVCWRRDGYGGRKICLRTTRANFWETSRNDLD